MTDDQTRDGRRVSAATRAAVEQYLTILTTPKKRGRHRTTLSVGDELRRTKESLTDGSLSPLDKLKAHQRIIELEAELSTLSNTVNIKAVEDEFVKVAAEYSHHRGISYEAWRAVGVDAAVLKRAGITRG